MDSRFPSPSRGPIAPGDAIEWIVAELRPRECTSAEFIYDDMESQSGRSLPVVYRPFDPGDRSHWRDRGAILDFLLSVRGEGARILDFGPGDGWPSLLLAPFAREVVGVDGSRRRVDVCAENAERLGIRNARFIHIAPGMALPFADGEFNGATAASSVEQTPDPRATLRELFRVLRPGARLRISYESLDGYRGGKERETLIWPLGDRRCRLVLYDRRPAEERAVQYGIAFDLTAKELERALSSDGSFPEFGPLPSERLERLRPVILDARACATTHPNGRTLVSWLRGIGFREVLPGRSGIEAAEDAFDRMPPGRRPKDLTGVDTLLRPLVDKAIVLAAPIAANPWITAVR
jgi:SAM-dependent methyltransferase